MPWRALKIRGTVHRKRQFSLIRIFFLSVMLRKYQNEKALFFQRVSVQASLVIRFLFCTNTQAEKQESVMCAQKVDIYHFFIKSDWTNPSAIAVLEPDTV